MKGISVEEIIKTLVTGSARDCRQLADSIKANGISQPEGSEIVPINLTKEMREAFESDVAPHSWVRTAVFINDIQERYKAMINAAPRPPYVEVVRYEHQNKLLADNFYQWYRNTDGCLTKAEISEFFDEYHALYGRYYAPSDILNVLNDIDTVPVNIAEDGNLSLSYTDIQTICDKWRNQNSEAI